MLNDQITGNEDIVDLLFQSTLGKPEYVRPQPSKIIGSLGSFHRCLTLMKKKQDNHKIFFRDVGDLLFGTFEHTLAYLTPSK